MTVAELEVLVSALTNKVDGIEKQVQINTAQVEQMPGIVLDAVDKFLAVKAESILLKGIKDLSIDIMTLPYQAGKYIVLGVRDLFKSGKKPQAIVTEQPAAEPVKA